MVRTNFSQNGKITTRFLHTSWTFEKAPKKVSNLNKFQVQDTFCWYKYKYLITWPDLFFWMIFVDTDFLFQGDLRVRSDQELVDVVIYTLSKMEIILIYCVPIYLYLYTWRCFNILYTILDSHLFPLGGFDLSVPHQVCLVSNQNHNLNNSILV